MKLLNRLFNRGVTAPVAALLYSNVYNQPLCVEPIAAQAIIDGYLHGTITPESKKPRCDDGMECGEYDDSRIVSFIGSSIAIIDIYGALTAKPTGGDMCSAAPLSYEEISFELKRLMNDANVETIIGDFSSCGGQAMNMCDTSDLIYSMRGNGKRLIAMVGVQAASAAYGLASAFDEIWVTRTSVAGSIGTYVCLPNIQEKNKMEGFAFTYISSDAHKLDGNPDEPLSDSAKKFFTDDVLSIDKTFKETVARNLDVPVQQIYDMQAKWYRGEEAVKMGLAHKVGTFDELIASLLTTQQQEVSMATSPTPNGDNGAFSQLSETVNALAQQMGALTGLVQSLAEQPKLQATATEITGLCTAAGVPNAMAGLLIKSGATIEEVRAALQNQDVEQSKTVDINSFLPAKNGDTKQTTTEYDAFSMQEELSAQRKAHTGGK
jgi:ClpP class serine protease